MIQDYSDLHCIQFK